MGDLTAETSHCSSTKWQWHVDIILPAISSETEATFGEQNRRRPRHLPETEAAVSVRGNEIVEECRCVSRSTQRIVEDDCGTKGLAARVRHNSERRDVTLQIGVKSDRVRIGAVAVLTIERLDYHSFFGGDYE